MKESKPSSQLIGKFAAIQSVAEIGLGSVLHSLHVPLAGHFLSLNQAAILCLAAKRAESRKSGISLTAGISNIAALLKSFSPIGKRLTPMLAISVQGILFSLGLGLMGVNALGVALGSALLSLWGICQPILIAYLLFGSTLFEGIAKAWTEVASTLGISTSSGIGILIGLVSAKALVAASLAVWIWRSGEEMEERYLRQIQGWRKIQQNPSPRQAPSAWLAFRDLFTPWFLASVVLSFGFIVVSKSANGVALSWYALRTIAAGFFFFWLLRAFPMSWVREKAQTIPALRDALDRLLSSENRGSPANHGPEEAPQPR